MIVRVLSKNVEIYVKRKKVKEIKGNLRVEERKMSEKFVLSTMLRFQERMKLQKKELIYNDFY